MTGNSLFEEAQKQVEYWVEHAYNEAKTAATRGQELLRVIKHVPSLEDLPMRQLRIGSWMWPVTFYFPLDFAVEKAVLRRFADSGWEKNEQDSYNGSWGRCHAMYHESDKVFPHTSNYGRTRIMLRFEADDEEATCEVVAVGERKVERVEPIYEIVCKEGASEGF